MNCECSETQPRRGKNLPENGLDSRAKKLSPQDKDDYEFTLKWLDEFAHPIYRDRQHHILELTKLTEVSLCKAHSSTLYRAKKKHQRNHQAPPSPADSVVDNRSSSVESYLLLPQPTTGLAAKVRELSFQPPPPPDFSMMTSSSSTKRKRLNHPPSSSTSTPLFQYYNTRQPTSSFSSQLPPLHLQSHVIETVSLKSSPSIGDNVYYLRNLAITDTYTFRDLLSEIDFAGSPPPNKRIIISDGKRVFPLGQAIRSVIKYPNETHVELYLGLADKPSINWSHYK